MPVLNKSDEVKTREYEEFIKTSPYGHFMQSINWAKVKNNWESDYVYLENKNGKITAAMSIISVKNDDKHSFMYCPRGPVCDINDLSVVKELLKEALPVIKKRNGFLLRMDPEIKYSDELLAKYENANIDNLRIMSVGNDEHAFSNPRMHMIADISMHDYDKYLETVSSNHRNKIRKGYRSNLETLRIRKNDKDFQKALNTFYELTKIMAERQNINFRPIEYFQKLFDAFNDVVLYQTRDEEEVLSSCIVITYNKKSFYAYAASSNNKRKLYPNNQMNNEALKDAIEKGSSQYDMGGIFSVDDNNGLYRFKKIFCGESGLFDMLGQLDFVYDENLYNKFLKR